MAHQTSQETIYEKSFLWIVVFIAYCIFLRLLIYKNNQLTTNQNIDSIPGTYNFI